MKRRIFVALSLGGVVVASFVVLTLAVHGRPRRPEQRQPA